MKTSYSERWFFTLQSRLASSGKLEKFEQEEEKSSALRGGVRWGEEEEDIECEPTPRIHDRENQYQQLTERHKTPKG